MTLGFSIADMSGLAGYAEAPDFFGALDPDDLDGYFQRRCRLEEAERGSRLADELARLRVDSVGHWRWIEASFFRRHFGQFGEGEDHRRFALAVEEARRQFRASRWQAVSELAPALLAPAENVTIDQWAKASAALSRCVDAKTMGETLAEHAIAEDTFARVDEEFRARMGVDRHGVIAAIFDRAQATVAKGSSPRIPRLARGTVTDEEVAPCTFERFVKIASAQELWTELCRDVEPLIAYHFGLGPDELVYVSHYWGTRCSADPHLAAKLAADKLVYKQRLAAATPVVE